MWSAAQIERVRLAEIAWLRRLTGARAVPVNAPSEWIGWSIIVPTTTGGATYSGASRAPVRAGGGRPLATRTLCAVCRDGQRRRSADLRARRRGAGRCIQCGEHAGRFARCVACRGAVADAG